MKILLSAMGCNPSHGSEGAIGWKAARALGRDCSIHVLTSASNKQALERELATGAHPNLSFTCFGTDARYHQNRLLARIQSWVRYVHWTRQSLEIAQRLVQQQHFDIAHHVSYSAWRVPSPLWRLDLPFVWGPVGGTAEYPAHLLGKLSTHSAVFEVLRGALNLSASHSKALKACVRNSAAVVASNKESFQKLADLRGGVDGVHVLSPTFFTSHEKELLDFDPANKSVGEKLNLFCGGNMIGPKGLIFALEGLQLASHHGIKWQLIVGGHGPEIPFLKNKSRELGICGNIDFHTGFAGDAYRRKLKEAHVFLLPSFRENAPGTILEAMLAGCVPIVMDASAQSDIVVKNRGIKIPVGDAASIAKNIYYGIRSLHENRELRIRMGVAAKHYVSSTFTECNYVKSTNIIYNDAMKGFSERLSF